MKENIVYPKVFVSFVKIIIVLIALEIQENVNFVLVVTMWVRLENV